MSELRISSVDSTKVPKLLNGFTRLRRLANKNNAANTVKFFSCFKDCESQPSPAATLAHTIPTKKTLIKTQQIDSAFWYRKPNISLYEILRSPSSSISDR